MRDPFDQFNNPMIREAIKHFQRTQNDPGYQMMMREMQRRRENPLYEQIIRDVQRLHDDPRYQSLLKDLKRRQENPTYKAMLDSLRDERLRDLPITLRNFPDFSQMRDLLESTKALKSHEFDRFTSRIRDEHIQIFLDAEKLRDNANLLRTFEDIERSQRLFDSQFNQDDLLNREEIYFNPPLAVQPPKKAAPSAKEQVSAEFFLLDLQTNYEELSKGLAENEQIVVYALLNGFTVKVNSCVADTFNRIRLNGMLGDNETVILIQQSTFTIMFRKEPVEPEKPKRRIGFVIEEEIAEDDEDFDS